LLAKNCRQNPSFLSAQDKYAVQMNRDFPPFSTSHNLPASWREQVQAQLAAGENVIAWIALDLDVSLRFVSGLLLATDRRLLACAGSEWRSWEYRAGLLLKHADHAGVGTLELQDGQARLALWRYTLAQNPAALRLINQFDQQRDARLSGQAAMQEELCDLPGGQGSTTFDLGAVPSDAFCQALQGFLVAGLSVDAGINGRHAGAAVHDHAADGQCVDPVPERRAAGCAAGRLLSEWLAWLGAGGLDTGLGPHLYSGVGE